MSIEKSFKNRIVGHGTKSPNDFKMNPSNPKIHPEKQQKTINSLLKELGFIAPVIINSNTGFVIDGHERIRQSIEEGFSEVPFVEVDLTVEEETLALSTFDFVVNLAIYDKPALDAIIDATSTNDENILSIFKDIYDYTKYVYEPSTNPEIVNKIFNDEDIIKAKEQLENAAYIGASETVEVMCPHCGEKFYVKA